MYINFQISSKYESFLRYYSSTFSLDLILINSPYCCHDIFNKIILQKDCFRAKIYYCTKIIPKTWIHCFAFVIVRKTSVILCQTHLVLFGMLWFILYLHRCSLTPLFSLVLVWLWHPLFAVCLSLYLLSFLLPSFFSSLRSLSALLSRPTFIPNGT